jgi:hypothetical protein
MKEVIFTKTEVQALINQELLNLDWKQFTSNFFRAISVIFNLAFFHRIGDIKICI